MYSSEETAEIFFYFIIKSLPGIRFELTAKKENRGPNPPCAPFSPNGVKTPLTYNAPFYIVDSS
jgi:hypothetical protein